MRKLFIILIMLASLDSFSQKKNWYKELGLIQPYATGPLGMDTTCYIIRNPYTPIPYRPTLMKFYFVKFCKPTYIKKSK